MKYLLDSNIVSEASKPNPNAFVIDCIEKFGMESALSSISAFELAYGVAILPECARKERLKSFLSEMVFPFYDVLPYDLKCSRIHAIVMAKLKSLGLVIPYQDSQIATVALANNLILVTRNVKDFEPIAKHFSLKIENWFDVT